MKKFILLILSIIFIANSLPAYAAENCSDWASDYIDFADSAGVIPEELKNRYTEDITRLEFTHLAITMISAMYDVSVEHFAENIDSSGFSDTDDIYVSIANSLGIISGTGNGKFSPDNKITRQEAAKILVSTYAVCTNDYSPALNYTNSYTDYDMISDWAKTYVDAVTAWSIMKGVSENTFAPLSPYTIEQGIVTFLRLYEHIIKSTQLPPESNNKNPEITSMLYVENGHLTNGSNRIILNGINLGGWLIMEEWMSPVASFPDAAYSDIIDTLTSRFGEYRTKELIKSYENNFITDIDFYIIESLGFNCVRIPFWYRNFTDAQGNVELDSEGFKRLDWALEQCKEHGIYAILDMHGCPGGQSMNHSTGVTAKNELYTNEKNLKIMENVWTAIAGRYRNNNCVAAYDIMNEPQNNGNYVGSNAWKPESAEAVAHTNSVYDRMIRAIRKVDEKHTITVEGIWTIDVLPDPAEYDWTNMLYQLHIYDTTTDMIDQRVSELVSAREKYDVAVLVGEYNSKTLERYASEKYLANDINRIKWTYKTFNVSYDNWGLFDKQYNKINLRTASYDEIKAAFDNDIRTDKGFLFNIKEYNLIKHN